MSETKPAPLLRNLSVLNYANGFTSWHYRVPKDHEPKDVLAEGYFAPFADLITEGDKVIISGPAFAMEGFFFNKGPAIRFVLPHNGVAPPMSERRKLSDYEMAKQLWRVTRGTFEEKWARVAGAFGDELADAVGREENAG